MFEAGTLECFPLRAIGVRGFFSLRLLVRVCFDGVSLSCDSIILFNPASFGGNKFAETLKAGVDECNAVGTLWQPRSQGELYLPCFMGFLFFLTLVMYFRG